MLLIFNPAIQVLNRLKFTAKFSLVFVLFLVPVIYVAYATIDRLNQKITQAEKEKHGVEFLVAIRPIYITMAQVRGMTNAFLNGKTSVEGDIRTKREALQGYFKKLQAVDKKYSQELKTSTQVNDLLDLWTQLQTNTFSMSAGNAFDQNTLLIEKTLALGNHVIDTSGLILDSDIVSHFLMDASFHRLPLLIENMGSARGVGSGIAAAGERTAGNYLKLANAINSIDTAIQHVQRSLELVFEEDPGYRKTLGPVLEQAVEVSKNFSDITRQQLMSANAITVDPVEYFNRGSEAIKSVLSLFDIAIPALDNRISELIDGYQQEIRFYVIAGTLLLAMVLYIFVGFYLGVMQSINEIARFVNQVAEGNLGTQLDIDSQDEMKIIADDLNSMVTKIRNLIAQVIHNAKIVNEAAKTGADTAQQTLQGANRQNHEIDQVATAMNEMSATVQEVAKNAATTSEATQHADEQTSKGQAVVKSTIESINGVSNGMQRVTEAINKLEEDSGNIGTVLDVIRSIAEQTNLLALNAAIEAARAGEQGRGFAVVADEVRTLASRTQTSTAEIHEIIEQIQLGATNAVEALDASNNQTQVAVEKAAEAGRALEAITQAVDNITQMNFQIASAAEEQSQVAEEINRNIVNVSNIATETAQDADVMAANSESLKEVADRMQTVVSEFKV